MAAIADASLLLLYFPTFMHLLLPHPCLSSTLVGEPARSSCKNDYGSHGGDVFTDAEMFSKLKLNEQQLYGSRWAVEHKGEISVSHAIDIVDATLVHSNQLTLSVEFNLRQSWSTPDLEFPVGLFKEEDKPGTFVSATDRVLDYMWSPDSYISTTRESNMNTVDTPLSLVYIFKNRTIIYKVRMFTKVGCTSSFQWYPRDIQSCDLVIESYKYQDDIVRYYWTDEKLYRPIMIKINRLFQYELRLPLHYDNGSVERGGRSKRYPFVRIRFTFERKLGNNLIQVYTPTLLVVVLSWFSFWLGLDAIPGRISLLVTCMLTLVTMHSGIKSSIPPVAYITMMDLWMVACMASVFSAMCEFIVVKYLHWRRQQQQQKQSVENPQMMTKSDRQTLNMFKEAITGIFNNNDCSPLTSNKNNTASVEMLSSILVGTEGQQGTVQEQESLNEKPSIVVWMALDKLSRVVFPTLFLLFNLFYWPVLMFRGGQEESQE